MKVSREKGKEEREEMGCMRAEREVAAETASMIVSDREENGERDTAGERGRDRWRMVERGREREMEAENDGKRSKEEGV